MIYLGLDPGMDGAAAWLPTGSRELLSRPGDAPLLFRDHVIAAPSRGRQYDHASFHRALVQYPPDWSDDEVVAVLEDGPGGPAGMSFTSARSAGICFGLLLGVIGCRGWKVVKVRPADWHRALFGKGVKGDAKARALAFVRDQYPEIDLTVSGRFRKPHEGFVDAICLAHYGRIKRP